MLICRLSSHHTRSLLEFYEDELLKPVVQLFDYATDFTYESKCSVEAELSQSKIIFFVITCDNYWKF